MEKIIQAVKRKSDRLFALFLILKYYFNELWIHNIINWWKYIYKSLKLLNIYIQRDENEKCLFSNTHELDIIFW